MIIHDSGNEELMHLYASILAELIDRKVVRTYNTPVGDYAEWLVAEKMGLELVQNANRGFDALDPNNGMRYQIKSRWEHGNSNTRGRQLGVIRNYDDEKQFDYLVAVIFSENFSVKEAYLIPHDTIRQYAKFSKHQNGYILSAKGHVLRDPSVKKLVDTW